MKTIFQSAFDSDSSPIEPRQLLTVEIDGVDGEKPHAIADERRQHAGRCSNV